jgi:hypothetical protein
MPKVFQPPIQPLARDREEHAWWPAGLAVFFGVVLAGYGFLRVTPVETVQGNLALETEVNVALAHGGVKDAEKTPPPPPPDLQNWDPSKPPPAPPPAPLVGISRLRIDLSAKAACPT